MSELSFSPVAEGERARALATLVLAFAADPVERWLYPGSEQYLASFPRFLAAFGGRAFDEQTAWRLGELPCSLTASHQDSMTTCSLSWARWMQRIRRSRTGTFRGSASIPPCRAKG
jgi:hypothetical protein